MNGRPYGPIILENDKKMNTHNFVLVPSDAERHIEQTFTLWVCSCLWHVYPQNL